MKISVFERLSKFLHNVRFVFTFLSQLVLTIIPVVILLGKPSEAVFVKNVILASVSFLLLIFTVVTKNIDEKKAETGRKIASKFRSFSKLIANIAMLVVMVIMWRTNQDYSVLLPMMVTTITVSVSIVTSLSLLLVDAIINGVKRKVVRSAEGIRTYATTRRKRKSERNVSEK